MLSVKNLSKSYSGKPALSHLSFSVKKGKIAGVLGESGSGKTTLLQLLAGLLEPDTGKLLLNTEAILPPSGKLVAGHEKIKLVSQDARLFPNATVRENIAYPLRKYEKSYVLQRTDELLKLCLLEPVQDRLPKEISGGEKQRTALAQALADEPELLLLDEPFSNMDVFNKQRLKNEIRRLVKKLKITCLLVSHDATDVLALADTLLILRHGNLLQAGTPESILQNPVNEYVTGLLGASPDVKTNVVHILPSEFTARILSSTIQEHFDEYLQQFLALTRQAALHFANRHWHNIQELMRERLHLYKNLLLPLADQLIQNAGKAIEDKRLWQEAKELYHTHFQALPFREIAFTFYNSVFHKIFHHTLLDNALLFVAETPAMAPIPDSKPVYEVYTLDFSWENLIRHLLEHFSFGLPFEDLSRDVAFLEKAFQEQLSGKYDLTDCGFEIAKPAFYRNRRFYIVGRIRTEDFFIPFLIPVLHSEKGIFADALLTDPNDISTIFSFTRSYFFTDTDNPAALVHFLHSFLPTKSLSELYNCIGFSKHGKTVFYREFIRHLQESDDLFISAPGIKGMVMTVFTLPSYPVVFKLIKDRFDPPKEATHTQVKAKYKLVSEYDRAGRMADTQEFANFRFNKSRFSPELLTELQRTVPSLLKIEDNELIIRHLYTERRMIPLNIFLEKVSESQALEVIEDYGNAIKQMAQVNIFPGDMLLKNFGVTRHRKVVFYDYDEIGFLTDYNFRKLPESSSYEEEMSQEPWFSVSPGDVFPEELSRFLIGNPHLRSLFTSLHPDLFDVTFWRAMQESLRKGTVPDIFPYSLQKRFQQRE